MRFVPVVPLYRPCMSRRGITRRRHRRRRRTHERHTKSGEVVPGRHVHHGTTPVPGRTAAAAAAAAAAKPVQLVDQQRRVAADDRLLRTQGLVAKRRVLQAAHAAVARVVGVEDVDDARDGLVPPLRVLFEVARALLVGEAVDGGPGPAVRVCFVLFEGQLANSGMMFTLTTPGG